MRRHLTHHTIRTIAPVILGLTFATCKGGGPTGPPDAPIALSTSSLVFQTTSEQPITITNLEAEPVEWRVLTSTASWLRASPASGTIDPHSSGSVQILINAAAVSQ